MKFSQSVFLALMVLMMSACATNGDAGSEPQMVDVKIVDGPVNLTSEDGSNKDEIVCTRRHQVGTHFPRTVCKSRREWDLDRAEARQEMDLQRQRNAAGRIDGRGADPTR